MEVFSMDAIGVAVTQMEKYYTVQKCYALVMSWDPALSDKHTKRLAKAVFVAMMAS
jgi:hypothetical protein